MNRADSMAAAGIDRKPILYRTVLAAVWSLGLAGWAWTAHVFAPWRDNEILAGWAVSTALITALVMRFRRLSDRALGWGLALAFGALGFAAGPMAMKSVSGRHHLPPSVVDMGKVVADLTSHRVRAAPIPELWFPNSLPEEDTNFVSQMLEGQLTLLDRPAAALGKTIDWKADPFRDRTWQLLLHSLSHTRPLIQRYRETQDASALRVSGSTIRQWIDANSSWYFAPPSEFSWNDHAIAFRSLAMLDYGIAAAGSIDAAELAVLVRSLKGHAEALASPLYYTPRHNHGLDQDIALLSVALVLRSLPESEDWRKLAVARLQAQLRDTLSHQGVHLEHSPGYQLSTLVHLVELYRIAAHFEVPEFSNPEFVSLLAKMAEFGRWTVQPNGQLVPFGDSFPWQNAAVFATKLQALVGSEPGLSGISIDPDRSPRLDGLSAFAEEGYVFFSARNQQGERIHHLAMTAAHNPGLAHKHADDLTLALSVCGRNVLVDHGGYGYNYDRWREYFLSRPAHNTVSLGVSGGEGLLIRHDGRPRIVGVTDDAGLKTIQAETQLSSDLRHRRTVLIKDGRHFLVHDRLLKSSRSAARSLNSDGLLHWHFAPKLGVEANGRNSFRISFDGLELAAISLDSPGDPASSLIVGRDSPPLGWASVERNAVIKAPTLQASLGSANEIVTAISLPRDCNSPAAIRGPQVRIETSSIGSKVLWSTEDGVANLVFGAYSRAPRQNVDSR